MYEFFLQLSVNLESLAISRCSRSLLDSWKTHKVSQTIFLSWQKFAPFLGWYTMRLIILHILFISCLAEFNRLAADMKNYFTGYLEFSDMKIVVCILVWFYYISAFLSYHTYKYIFLQSEYSTLCLYQWYFKCSNTFCQGLLTYNLLRSWSMGRICPGQAIKNNADHMSHMPQSMHCFNNLFLLTKPLNITPNPEIWEGTLLCNRSRICSLMWFQLTVNYAIISTRYSTLFLLVLCSYCAKYNSTMFWNHMWYSMEILMHSNFRS